MLMCIETVFRARANVCSRYVLVFFFYIGASSSYMKKLLAGLIPRSLLNLYALRPFAVITDLLSGRASLSYSQQSEDLAVLKYFGRRWGGTYVDIGAFHPSKYSNTKLFYKMGWTGINIEPNPQNFPFFQQQRPRDINLNIAIGTQSEKLTYYSFNNGAVNTFDRKHAEHWAAQPGFVIQKELEIDMLPLRDVLARYIGDRQIDFMSVDVEGMDLEVLKTNDWQKYRPTLLLVEDGDIFTYDSLMASPICTYLQEQGYYLHSIAGITMIFARK